MTDLLQCSHLMVVGDAQCRLCGERNDVTDNDGVDWGTVAQNPETINATPEGYGDPTAKPSYPEYPDNPHNHRYTISITGSGAPMIVVRGNTAAEMTAGLNELEAYGVFANVGAAHAALKAQGAVGNGLGPVTPVVPLQQAPVVALPPAGPPGGYAPVGPAPQQGGWQGNQAGYNGQQQQRGGYNQGNSGKAEPQPQPPGWPRVNARTGPGFDAWKNMREQYKDQFKGLIKWGGNADYWIDPSIAQWLQQQGFAVTP
jgi:hypothetical protein